MGWTSLEATDVEVTDDGRVAISVLVHDEYFAPAEGKVLLDKKQKRKLRRLLTALREPDES